MAIYNLDELLTPLADGQLTTEEGAILQLVQATNVLVEVTKILIAATSSLRETVQQLQTEITNLRAVMSELSGNMSDHRDEIHQSSLVITKLNSTLFNMAVEAEDLLKRLKECPIAQSE